MNEYSLAKVQLFIIFEVLLFNPLKVRLMRSVCGLDVHKDSVYLL